LEWNNKPPQGIKILILPSKKNGSRKIVQIVWPGMEGFFLKIIKRKFSLKFAWKE